MKKLLVCMLLTGAVSCASACSPVRTWDVSFERNSAEISNNEILRLANWLSDLRVRYTSLDRASIGGLAESGEEAAAVLAKRRAENVRQFLTSFGLGTASVDMNARVHRPSGVTGIRDNGRHVEIDVLPECPHECPCQWDAGRESGVAQ
ncbi:hypothetical protein [Burkholderia sp. Ac-20353]|uniref:hypothetical protein n=1 Tax=Burkholderia sp. Ac-20353 TaxID=2703894 RepID=UPI00197C2A76|nr:hypothetical protein [Burkholderia sp. Ac-20353]